jgi:membrane-bound metal-dependent hydrolase YbcI (DUF457 family)
MKLTLKYPIKNQYISFLRKINNFLVNFNSFHFIFLLFIMIFLYFVFQFEYNIFSSFFYMVLLKLVSFLYIKDCNSFLVNEDMKE